MNLGAVIKRLREARCWSSRECDDRLGQRAGHTATVEGRPSPLAAYVTVERYAELFGLTPSELWDLARREPDPTAEAS